MRAYGLVLRAAVAALASFAALGSADAQGPAAGREETAPDAAPASAALPSSVLTLAEALAAVDAQPAVRAARERVELARRELAAWSPVSGSLGASTTGAVALAGQGADSASLELSASLAFDLGWGGRSGADEAREALERAEDELGSARSSALQEVLRRYQAAAGAQRALRAAELGLRSAAIALEAARQRFAAGAVTEADLRSAEIAHTSAELDLREAEGDLRGALAQLGALLGRPVEAVAEDAPAVPSLPEVDVEERLALRTDVRAARRSLAAAEAALADARRAAGPRLAANVSLSASSGATSFQVGGGIDSASLDPSLSARLSTGTGASSAASSARASATLGLTVPLGGAADAAVAAAEATLRQAAAQLDLTLASARIEVEGLLRQLAVADERAAVSAALVAQAESALADAEARYALGLVSEAAVIDAQAALLRAVDQAASAAFERLSLTVQLAVALALDPMEVMP